MKEAADTYEKRNARTNVNAAPAANMIRSAITDLFNSERECVVLTASITIKERSGRRERREHSEKGEAESGRGTHRKTARAQTVWRE